MTAAVTKPNKHTRTFQSFVQLNFKGWGVVVTAYSLTDKSQGAKLESGWSELN